MHLRKSLVAAAAVVAAGLMAISGSALAATGTVSGSFVGGSASFAGSSYTCTTGSVSGTYNTTAANNLDFSTLSISCNTPVGAATISLNSCTVPVNFTSGKTAGVDTAVTGTAAFGTGTCVKVSALFGICTANVQGTVAATFNETVVSGKQSLKLNGSGTLANQSAGCGGALTGAFTLNNIEFSQVGTPAPINFV